MTGISESISWIRRDLLAPRHAPRFGDAGARCPALRPYRSVRGLLHALAGERPPKAVNAIAASLVAEYARERAGLWSGLLIVLCERMLLAQRAGLDVPAIDCEELDQIVLECFVASVAAMQAGEAKVITRLRADTRRGIVRAIGRERLEWAGATPTDLEPLADWIATDRDLASATGSSGDPNSTSPSDEEAMCAWLCDRAEGLLDAEALAMLRHTLVHRRRLGDYVAAARAEPTNRAYARVKRRHSRAIALLRRALAPVRRASRVEHRSRGMDDIAATYALEIARR